MIYRALCVAILLSYAAASPTLAQTPLEKPTTTRPATTKPGVAQSQTSAVNPDAVRAPTTRSPLMERLATVKKPGVSQATLSKSCKGKDGKTTTYTVSVPGGNCIQFGGSIGCKNSAGDTSEANCETGCVESSGNGSCTIATAR